MERMDSRVALDTGALELDAQSRAPSGRALPIRVIRAIRG